MAWIASPASGEASEVWQSTKPLSMALRSYCIFSSGLGGGGGVVKRGYDSCFPGMILSV